MRRSRAASAVALLLALTIVGPAPLPAPARTDSPKVRATVDKSVALVQLKGEPVTTYAKTKPTNGKKVDFNSTVTKSYRAQLSALRNDFKKWLQANAPKAQITGQLGHLPQRRVGQAQRHDARPSSRTAPQVRAVEYQGVYYPTADDPDLALVNAIAGLGRGRRPRERRRRCQGRPSSTPASTSPTRASTTPATAAADPDRATEQVHQQQGHRRQGLQQQGRQPAASTPKRSTPTAPTSPARSPATTRPTAGVDGVASRTTRPASRRRPCSATTTCSRAPSRTLARRTSSTRSMRPTPTASTS